MDGYEVTPQLTEHARERCAEMGIRTRVAKRIWRTRTMTYALRDQHRVRVTSAEVPEYALVVDDTDERPVIITVLFATQETYVREGATYRVQSKAS